MNVDLKHLQTLSEMKYQHSQKALSDLINRENELRRELERMRALLQKTQAQDPEDAQLRAVGGDIIWLKWLGRVQKELNMSLAGVLAQKEALLAGHRRATGRKIVTEGLSQQTELANRQAKQKAQLKSVIESTFFSPLD